MEHFYCMFASMLEKLVDLATDGRAFKSVLGYYDMISKRVKEKDKEIKALEDTVSRIAGEANGIVTPLDAIGKEF